MRANKQRAADVLQGRPRLPHETPLMMVNDISHLFFAKVRSMEPEGALSQHSARVILRLLIEEDGRKQTDLARAAHLSAPTVSATLRRMESEGLIERCECTRDARATRVRLSEKGRAQHAATLDMLWSLDAVTMQGLTAEETEQLGVLLGRLRDNLIASLLGEDTEGEGK